MFQRRSAGSEAIVFQFHTRTIITSVERDVTSVVTVVQAVFQCVVATHRQCLVTLPRGHG